MREVLLSMCAHGRAQKLTSFASAKLGKLVPHGRGTNVVRGGLKFSGLPHFAVYRGSFLRAQAHSGTPLTAQLFGRLAQNAPLEHFAG